MPEHVDRMVTCDEAFTLGKCATGAARYVTSPSTRLATFAAPSVRAPQVVVVVLGQHLRQLVVWAWSPPWTAGGRPPLPPQRLVSAASRRVHCVGDTRVVLTPDVLEPAYSVTVGCLEDGDAIQLVFRLGSPAAYDDRRPPR
ncbi:MAG: hypothetical protein M3431_11945 [Actinomycetota bacterium]|nr:hypothetical protein [Actinomycetota bacterium]